MFHRLCPLAAVGIVVSLGADPVCKQGAPCYGSSDIVNAASGTAGAITPNTLVRLYGTNLSFTERALLPQDVSGGALPVILPGTGVSVTVGGYAAQLYLVSPGQVNFLVPSNLRPGTVELVLSRQGTIGPVVSLTLRDAAPALFVMDPLFAIASHLDFSLVSAANPVHPGDWVTLWATGLGAVTPPAAYGLIPTQAAWLVRRDEFRVLLDGLAVPPERIGYVGLAPLCAGLYQINVRLPEYAGANPEVRIAVGDELSPPGVYLHLEK
jgi:uncharacterized protein (TIGR03437 family)